ncbi:MAG: tagatose 1,6-diphosphate aldolase [Acidobacteriota bacterium]
MNLSAGKLKRMQALANDAGVIAAVAMDQRGSLSRALAAAKGVDKGAITPEMLAEFKTAVSKILTPYASAILLDPEFGLDASKARSANAGLLLAYEKTGYINTRPGRLPDLIDTVSVKRLAVDFQADAVKVLLYYTPFEDARINDIKHAFVERVGAECDAYQIPFFLEFVGYDPKGGDEKGLDYARVKPEVVTRSMEEFSKPQYRVDVLKVEVPINQKFVGQAYTHAEALEHFRRAARAAKKPFIYLSAGVSIEQFVESLRMAGESGADFSGVLCGRATWQDGIPVYAKQGVAAFERWLRDEGVRNITRVNEALKPARPWFQKA